MKAESRKYSVAICSDSYTIMTDEPEASVLEAAARVDAAIRDIINKTTIDPKKAVILAALKISLELSKVHQKNDDTQQVLKVMLSKIEPLL